MFERAGGLRPDPAPTYWYWMDLLRFQSYKDEYPYVDKKQLRASLRAWKKGQKLSDPEQNFSWVFTSRALINEQRTRLLATHTSHALTNERRARLLDACDSSLSWEAITYLERQRLLAGESAHNLAYLARFHRMGDNQACALQASEKAVNLDPENMAAMEERAIILSNIGESAAAMKVLEDWKKLETGPDTWLGK